MDEPRSLLLIAYHFGPRAPTGGRRWNAMTTSLVRHGWNFDVITLDRPELAERKPHPGIRVHPVRDARWSLHMFQAAARLKRSIAPRGAPVERPDTDRPVLPDPARPLGAYTRAAHTLDDLIEAHGQISWCRRAVHVARALGAQRRFQAVITSSPPHITQIAGARIARALRVPHIADFRDPWVFGAPHTTSYSFVDRWLGRRFESDVMRTARLVLFNTERARRAAETLYAGEGIRAATLPNGYDPLATVSLPDQGHFRIVFTGWLYPEADIRPLLAACRRLLSRHVLTSGELRIEFIGPPPDYAGSTLEAVVGAHGLGQCFTREPWMPREDAVRRQQAAAVLLVFDYVHGLAIPAKFYDQAQMFGTLLLVGNPNGALADAGRPLGIPTFPPNDDAGIERHLEGAVRAWRTRHYVSPADPGGIFDRRHQSERLATLLENSLGVRDGHPSPPERVESVTGCRCAGATGRQ